MSASAHQARSRSRVEGGGGGETVMKTAPADGAPNPGDMLGDEQHRY